MLQVIYYKNYRSTALYDCLVKLRRALTLKKFFCYNILTFFIMPTFLFFVLHPKKIQKRVFIFTSLLSCSDLTTKLEHLSLNFSEKNVKLSYRYNKITFMYYPLQIRSHILREHL